MKTDEFVEIGYTMKPHGLSGEIKVFVKEPYEDAFFDLKTVFIDQKGKKVPYFLEQVRGGGALIASFEDIDDRDSAQAISSKGLWAKSADLPDISELISSEPDEPDFTGWSIHDVSQEKSLGIISEVVEYPQQLMAMVEIEGRPVMIPLNDAFIHDLDEKERILYMDLPEGLLDL